MKNVLLMLITVCVLLSFDATAHAQVSITTLGTPVSENFDTIGNSATATLPTGWRVDSATQTAVYASATTTTTRSAGTTGTGALNGTSSGGTYNFANGANASSTDRAVGFLSSGSYASPRNLFVQVTNNSGATITNLTIDFDIEKYRSGSRAFSINFFSSADGTNWTAQPAGDQAYPADAANTTVFNPPAATSKTVTLSNLSLASGASLYLRWQYAGNGGSTNGQALGIDNVSFTASGGAASPTITTTGTLAGFGDVPVGTTSAEQSYTISAAGLTSDLVITAPGEFQISTTSGANFGSSLTLTPVNGSVPTTTIYVRFAPTAPGAQSGDITHQSAGATTRNIAVSGTGVATYAVSGQVRNAGGVAVSGVTITLSGGGTTRTTVTAADGTYSFAGVVAGGNYTVTASGAGFTFTPSSQSIANLSANQIADFTAAGGVLISEFRFRGSDPDGDGTQTGSTDEFVELYNRTDAAIDIAGLTIETADGVVLFTVPAAENNRTLLPARASYLIGGTGFESVTPDATLTAGTDITDGTGIAIFGNASIRNAGTRLDAVGFTGASDLYREGAGLNPTGGITVDGEYSFYRKYAGGQLQDTGINSSDFVFVSNDAGIYNSIQSSLGAPGPQNTTSPVDLSGQVGVALLDPAASPSAAPNRVRDLTPTVNGSLGTFEYRKTYTNTSNLPITLLRFRITDLTTAPAPANTADLRALSSGDITVTRADGTAVLVRGTTIEAPPSGALGGGLNSTFVVSSITSDTPLAPGASVSVRFVLGVEQNGRLRFATNVEAIAQAPVQVSSSEHLVMGNPSNAVTDVNQPTNYLLEKTQYALSYHRDRGIPNWVSWHLDTSWLGSVTRQNDFREDPTLPAGWYRVQGTDYSGSGYDRGHMIPSADRTRTIPDNSATFLMTNIIPQAPDNNQGPWAEFENYCRDLVRAGNELYVISGGVGTQGTIANGRVAVPTRTWKVVIVLSAATGDDAARVTTQTRTIAIDMPNTNGIRFTDWRTYRVSVDQVEALTGYNFFSNVSIATQNVIEARVDNQ